MCSSISAWNFAYLSGWRVIDSIRDIMLFDVVPAAASKLFARVSRMKFMKNEG